MKKWVKSVGFVGFVVFERNNIGINNIHNYITIITLYDRTLLCLNKL